MTGVVLCVCVGGHLRYICPLNETARKEKETKMTPEFRAGGQGVGGASFRKEGAQMGTGQGAHCSTGLGAVGLALLVASLAAAGNLGCGSRPQQRGWTKWVKLHQSNGSISR